MPGFSFDAKPTLSISCFIFRLRFRHAQQLDKRHCKLSGHFMQENDGLLKHHAARFPNLL